MKTISKNARLSLTALVFGAALITGVESKAMNSDSQSAIAKERHEKDLAFASVIESCVDKSLKDGKFSTFNKCMIVDLPNGEMKAYLETVGEEEAMLKTKGFMSSLPDYIKRDFSEGVDQCEQAGNDRMSCVDNLVSFLRITSLMADRLKNDASFANN